MATRDVLPEVWHGGRNHHPTHVGEVHRLQQGIDKIFENFFNAPLSLWDTKLSEYIPACDIDEDDTHYLVNLDLPGVKKDDVKISVSDNQLSISGERKEESKGRHGRERYYGSFSRSFTLPSNVKADHIEACYENGVLHIAIPKKEASTKKQIPIKEGKLTAGKSEK